MRLKSIKLAGFKSFVDPTTVSFPSNMCAVVGPNGCGKSNVIDAVRWVMGESSAKNLRGESMADVIFNGSVNRQPVGQASIELVFDNSDGGVGGEYAAYAEIAIKRQVTREGQSEYFLNGTKCRRRDITDIFLGTGLGPRSYAIIEQGMISRLIESKPEELRVFIEEAAGISKYKERRKETESRMRRTLENLERLTDLRDELERQLQHLQRQAQAAEKYSEFKVQERTLSAQLLALQWQDLDAQIRQESHDIGELEVQLEAVHAEHQQVDTAIERHRIDHGERNEAFNKVQATYYSLGAEVARVEQGIQHQKERSRQLGEDLGQTRESLAQAEEHLVEDRDKLEAWSAELEQLKPELEALQTQESHSGEALSAAEAAMHSWQQEWDEFNQHAAEPRQQAEVQQSRIQHLEQVLRRIQQRIEQLESEQAGIAAGPATEEMDGLSREIDDLEAQMALHERAGNEHLDRLRQQRQRVDDASAELNALRSEAQQARGRQASLEALQQAAREDSSARVDDWLHSKGLSGKPRLVERLQVADGWQRAVETVLGDELQAVCVDQVESLSHLMSELEEGMVTLVAPGSEASTSADSLASKVSGYGLGDTLLHGVRCAADLPTAMSIRASLGAGESVITPEGLWLGRNWLKVARPADNEQGGVIARQAELEQLQGRIASLGAREEALALEVADARRSQQQLEEQRQQSLQRLQAATRQHADTAAQLSALQAKTEQLAARRERMQSDLSESREQFASETRSMAEARQLLSTAIEGMESDSQRREALLSVRDATRGTLDSSRQRARHDKDAVHQLAMRHRSLQTQVESVQASIGRTGGQVEQLRERRKVLDLAVAENDAPLAGLQQELEGHLARRLESEAELSQARQAVAEIEHELRESERSRAQIEQRAQQLRGDLEQRRVNNQGLQVKRDTVQQQLKEGDQDLEGVIAELPEGANEPEWQNGLERIANRIARLGPINLAAIDEYNQQSERKQYLDAQDEDLQTALSTLESAIRKIDKETRNRFRETFDKVNTGLQELFPRVFGGGSAYLEMTGDDLLDTGISIMARPPGKKNSTIHLLSGGEKALTAIALVFSIFQLNPAPFCMLDEVDAPLDDANVGRYARMVKEMSEKVQFIYITHNKISMELAEQLMGVTMHEPGVSRLVSVDVDEAAELAAS
ncbi:MAG: chromosome segregation protein SMC [Pseudomonadota bacterium]